MIAVPNKTVGDCFMGMGCFTDLPLRSIGRVSLFLLTLLALQSTFSTCVYSQVGSNGAVNLTTLIQLAIG